MKKKVFGDFKSNGIHNKDSSLVHFSLTSVGRICFNKFKYYPKKSILKKSLCGYIIASCYYIFVHILPQSF